MSFLSPLRRLVGREQQPLDPANRMMSAYQAALEKEVTLKQLQERLRAFDEMIFPNHWQLAQNIKEAKEKNEDPTKVQVPETFASRFSRTLMKATHGLGEQKDRNPISSENATSVQEFTAIATLVEEHFSYMRANTDRFGDNAGQGSRDLLLTMQSIASGLGPNLFARSLGSEDTKAEGIGLPKEAFAGQDNRQSPPWMQDGVVQDAYAKEVERLRRMDQPEEVIEENEPTA